MKVDQIPLAPAQCRAGRGWLEWTQERLAQEAGVGLSTIKDFESSKRAPVRNNLLAIQHALEKEGLTFEFDERGDAKGVGHTRKKAGSLESEPGQV